VIWWIAAMHFIAFHMQNARYNFQPFHPKTPKKDLSAVLQTMK
jgi:hypothetical protein